VQTGFHSFCACISFCARQFLCLRQIKKLFDVSLLCVVSGRSGAFLAWFSSIIIIIIIIIIISISIITIIIWCCETIALLIKLGICKIYYLSRPNSSMKQRHSIFINTKKYFFTKKRNVMSLIESL